MSKTALEYLEEIKSEFPFEIGDVVKPNLTKMREHMVYNSKLWAEQVFGEKKIYLPKVNKNDDRKMKPEYKTQCDERTNKLMSFVTGAGNGVVVGIKTHGMHVEDAISNGCYVTGGNSWSGLSSYAQVLFVQPHPDGPEQGEMAMMTTIHNAFLTKVEKPVPDAKNEDPFKALKKIQIEKTDSATITIKGMPHRFFKSLLTESSLYCYLSAKSYEIEKKVDPSCSSSVDENIQYNEIQHRWIKYVENEVSKSVFGRAEAASIHVKDLTLKSVQDEMASDAAYNEILQREWEKNKHKKFPDVEPIASLALGRFELIKTLEMTGYALSGCRGVLVGNSAHSITRVLEYAQKIRAHIELAEALLQKANQPAAEDDTTLELEVNLKKVPTHPLERGL